MQKEVELVIYNAFKNSIIIISSDDLDSLVAFHIHFGKSDFWLVLGIL